jgi:hypothetical protein
MAMIDRALPANQFTVTFSIGASALLLLPDGLILFNAQSVFTLEMPLKLSAKVTRLCLKFVSFFPSRPYFVSICMIVSTLIVFPFNGISH